MFLGHWMRKYLRLLDDRQCYLITCKYIRLYYEWFETVVDEVTEIFVNGLNFMGFYKGLLNGLSCVFVVYLLYWILVEIEQPRKWCLQMKTIKVNKKQVKQQNLNNFRCRTNIIIRKVFYINVDIFAAIWVWRVVTFHIFIYFITSSIRFFIFANIFPIFFFFS